MRLLHVTHQYRPAIGGAEEHFTSLSEELACRDHQVTVFTSRSRDYRTWRSELPACELLSGVQVHRFRCLHRGARTWRVLQRGYHNYWRTGSRRYEPLILLGNGPVCPGLFWRLLREASDYAVMHINNLHYAHAATAYAAARWRGVPVVLTPHVHIEQPATFDVGYMWAILKGSDHVVADTQAERDFLIKSGLEPQRVTTAGVGLDPAQFPTLDQTSCRQRLGLPGEAFVLLFLGRKTEYKGLELLLQTFAALHTQYPNLYLMAIGAETEYSQALWARHNGLPRLIRYDSVPDQLRLEALNACDCLVLPSTGEAFGIVFLEAWAVGKPVIGVHTRAVSSLIRDGWDGYVLSKQDPGQLADRIVHLLQNPAFGREMGGRGQAKAKERYSISRITDIVEGVYLRVLRRFKRQSD